MKEKIIQELLSNGWAIVEENEGWSTVLQLNKVEAHVYKGRVIFTFEDVYGQGSDSFCSISMEWSSTCHSWELLQWLAAEPNKTPAATTAHHRGS